ncbi:MAG: MerR family transcriptional regulator [Lachnospiraceae bacterium]|nr:MerR family transcriptional regulator [Lachnospiraceae bacterium]
MKTVKEVSKLTGISVRTLHYYDKIDLLTPSLKSDAGYRLYDDTKLEILQQILFFREFDISLKEIKAIINNPDLDKCKILTMQKNMLITKKERIERLIEGIDEVLKGETSMDFSIFNKSELEEMFLIMTNRMPKDIQELAIKEFGSIQEWKKHYIEILSSKELQEQYAEIVKMYGNKDNYLSFLKEKVPQKENQEFKQWEDTIITNIISLKDSGNSREISKSISEYGAGCKKFYRMKDEKAMMLSLAKSLRNEMVYKKIDEKLGNGASDFLAQEIEKVYQ